MAKGERSLRRIPGLLYGFTAMFGGMFKRGPTWHEYPDPNPVKVYRPCGRPPKTGYKPAFSMGYRGSPRLLNNPSTLPRLDGPKGIPYRYKGFPVQVRRGRVYFPDGISAEHRVALLELMVR